MAPKRHPADEAAEHQMLAAIRSADHFMASLFRGTGYYEKASALTVRGALREARRLEANSRNTQRCMIYAVGKDGRATFLTMALIEKLLKVKPAIPTEDDNIMPAKENVGIPPTLIISPEERAAAWNKNPQKAPTFAQKQETTDMPRKINSTTKASARKPVAAKKPTIPAKDGARSRYDWSTAEEMAANGKVPPPLDFSAPTHARFRDALAEVVKAAKAGDEKALKAVKINPISSSPKALDRYRGLCLKALKAKVAA